MDYLPCNLTYREEILLLFPLTIASPRYKQMAAWQRNGDVFVPIPRTRLAWIPTLRPINAEARWPASFASWTLEFTSL